MTAGVAPSDRLANVLSHFPDARQRGSEWMARCPAHEDRKPSLSIAAGSRQPVVLRCFAGCTTDAILAAAGLTIDDVSNSLAAPILVSIRTTRYAYRDATGSIVNTKVRTDGPEGKFCHWEHTDRPARVLYRLPELMANPSALVWFVEGEKCVDRLAALGLTATCNPNGSGETWRPEYTTPLVGRRIVVLPDYDEPGRVHAEKVVAALDGIANARILELPGLSRPGSDVVDWLASGHTADELRKLAEPWATVYDIDPGPAPAPLLDPFISADGTTILFGDGGSGKSTIAIAFGLTIAAGSDVIAGYPPSVSGPVIYADFEGYQRTIARRAQSLWFERVPLIYEKCAGTLAENAVRLGRLGRDSGAVLLIVDSLSFALPGNPKEPDIATAYFDATQRIGLPTLSLAHQRKDEAMDPMKPFGSAHFHNGARMTWHVKMVDQDRDQGTTRHELICRKANDEDYLNVRHGIGIQWGDKVPIAMTTMTVTDPTLADLIGGLLAVTPMTVAAIAERLDKAERNVRTILTRHQGARFQTYPTSPTTWGLV